MVIQTFFPPLLDHNVATIHLNALDTSPVGLSCLLIWPCFFGPVVLSRDWTCRTPTETGPVVLSPIAGDALVPFPGLHGETGPTSHRLALLLCTVRRDASVPLPGFHGTLFQSKCSLPSTLTLATASFVNFELRAAVGLGWFVILHTSCTRASELGELLVQICWSFSTRPKTFAEL